MANTAAELRPANVPAQMGGAGARVCRALALWALALCLRAFRMLRAQLAFGCSACVKRLTLRRLFPGANQTPHFRRLRAHACCKLNKAPPALA